MSDIRTEFELPFLTEGMEGIGGTIKTRDEDFLVEEVPLYRASGEGEYTLALIEKKGVSTNDAVGHLTGALSILRKHVAFAGRKDTHSISRQWITVYGVSPERLLALKLKRVKVLTASRHDSRIGLGHLSANGFTMRIRNFAPPVQKAFAMAEEVLAALMRRGCPNYFGPQRFGRRRDGHLIGPPQFCGNSRAGDYRHVLAQRSAVGDNPVVEIAVGIMRADFRQVSDQ
jgi:tRNA pseudouridine13 synthase